MGRIRTIKPEAFLDEELWDAETDTGLPLFRAFTGLWTQADREGRFEWRPRKLKAAILPYWDGDFSRVLDALTTRAFLVRYASNGDEFGCVRTFSKHQIVNNREVASEIPAPPAELLEANNCAVSTRASRVDDACPTTLGKDQVEGKGTGKEQEQKKNRAKRSVPEDFAIDDEMWNWATRETPTVDIEAATAAFVDDRRSKGVTYTDPVLGWRTWMRNAIKWGPHKAGIANGTTDTRNATERSVDELLGRDRRG